MINITKKLQIHEAAIEALKHFQKETSYIDIYTYIIENSLFSFGAKKEKPEQVLRKIIERKCINSNLSYKTNDIHFYKKNNKYGLLSWLKEEEIANLTNQDIAIQREIKISNEKQRLGSKIKELEEALKKESNDKSNLKKESQQYKENFSKLEEEIQILKKEKFELLEYEKEIDKIKTAIKILKNPAVQLIESKKSYLQDKEKFSRYADNLFIVSMSFFVIVFSLILISFGFDVFSKQTNWSLYLIIIFPIAFPSLLSFLFTRQANLKSQEIEKINKRFILIHEVNQALEALVEINRGKNMDGKTEKIIDKLINNILDFSIDFKENKKDKVELNDISNKVDFIMKSIKNININ